MKINNKKFFMKNRKILIKIRFFFKVIISMFVLFLLKNLISSKADSYFVCVVEEGFCEDFVTTEGFIFKDQYLIEEPKSESSDMHFVVEEGQKVPKGGIIASRSQATKKKHRHQNRQKKLGLVAQKENLPVNDLAYDAVDESKISNLVFELVDSVYNKDMSGTLWAKREMCKKPNDEQSFNFDKLGAKKTKSKKTKEFCVADCEGTAEKVMSPLSGVFSKNIDGYENILQEKNLSLVTSDFITDLSEHKSNCGFRNYQGDACKIVNNYEWKFVTKFEVDKLNFLNEGDLVRFRVRDVSCEDILGKVLKILPGDNNSRAVVVSSSFLTESIYCLSKIKVDIIESKTYGLKVPTKYVACEDFKKGVYVIQNKTLKFKNIEVLKEGGDCCIIKESAGPNSLKLYDEIVISKS